ncbi:MAG: acyltransferase [Bacteroidetes bacterium]|nr:acyltransferase [Bacteroidota bacterium]
MILRLLYWDLKDKSTRFDYLYELVRNLPGRVGFYLRKKILSPKFLCAGENIRIHKGCRIINIDKVNVGNNVHFGVDSYIQGGGGITIGDYTEMGPGVKIWSQTHIYDDPDSNLEGAGYEYNEVNIGKNVWIGANSFIMPGATIDDGCVVSACSVVGLKKWPQNSIIAGNPARKIGERGLLRKQES